MGGWSKGLGVVVGWGGVGGSYGNTLTFHVPLLYLYPSLSLSLAVPFSLSISHPRRMSLSGFHDDLVAVAAAAEEKEARVHGRGRKWGARRDARLKVQARGSRHI